MTTRWLNDEEKTTWRLWITATRLMEEKLDAQLREDAGMPHSYYEILVRLSASPDRAMRMRDLAEVTLSSRSRLSHAIGKLEGLGWVSREQCAEDGRGLIAVLTDEGFAALAEAAPGHVETVRTHLFDPLDPGQLEALTEACARMIAALGVDPTAVAATLD